MTKLKLNRVFFRAVEPFDFEITFKWENDPKNWLQSGVEKPYTTNEIKKFVNNKQDLVIDGQMRWMIISSATKQVIGALDLFNYNAELESANIGILIDESFRGQGFASEAIVGIETYCKEAASLNYLECQVLENNIMSQKLFKKLGYKQTNSELDSYFYLGEYFGQLTFRKEL